MPLEPLTRQRIVQALNLLGRLAEQEGVQIELCINSVEQIEEHIGRFYPGDALTAQARAIVTGILEEGKR
jgi:hypothetical protein